MRIAPRFLRRRSRQSAANQTHDQRFHVAVETCGDAGRVWGKSDRLKTAKVVILQTGLSGVFDHLKSNGLLLKHSSFSVAMRALKPIDSDPFLAER
jgi:hypothetical protein